MLYRGVNQRSTRYSRDPRHWPEGATEKSLFGQHILWHSLADGGRHMTEEDLEVYRTVGDAEVDQIFTLLEEESGRRIGPGQDILARAASASSDNSSSSAERALHEFYTKYSKLPEWVDLDQLQRGQNVFLAYLPAIGLSLYYRSLVPGFSIPNLAHVLQTTGYLAPPASRENVRDRLTDTGGLLLQCFTNLQSLLPVDGEGWKACLYVRFLHAKVRRAILHRQGKRKWDESRGLPICEEDMAATLLAFSVNSLLGVEILLGYPLSRHEREDFMAVWRWIGWLLGVRVLEDNSHDSRLPKPLDPCGPGWYEENRNSYDHGASMLQSIIFHLMKPDDASVEIAHFLLWQGRPKEKMNENRKLDMNNWFYYRALQCRRFVGDDLADALKLPLNPSLYYRWRSWIFSTCFLSVMTCYTILGLPWSPFRTMIVGFHRRSFERISNEWKIMHMTRMKKELDTESPSSSCYFSMIFAPKH